MDQSYGLTVAKHELAQPAVISQSAWGVGLPLGLRPAASGPAASFPLAPPLPTCHQAPAGRRPANPKRPAVRGTERGGSARVVWPLVRRAAPALRGARTRGATEGGRRTRAADLAPGRGRAAQQTVKSFFSRIPVQFVRLWTLKIVLSLFTLLAWCVPPSIRSR